MATEPRLLTDGQRKLVGFSLTLLELLATVALFALAVWVLGWLVSRFSGVIWPLAVAGVLALILRPVVVIFEKRLRLRRLPAVFLLYALFVSFATGLALVTIPPLARQLQDFIAFLPTLWDRAFAFVEQSYPDWKDLIRRSFGEDAVRSLRDPLLTGVQTFLSHILLSLQAAGSGVLSVLGFVTGLAVIPIYLFFFLRSRGEPTDRLADHLTFLSPGVRGDLVFLIREFIAIVVAFFRGQFLIGLLMGVLFAAGFTLVGLKFALIVGLAFGILNIVPYLGTIIGLAVSLPLALFQPGGSWLTVALAALVFVVVHAIESLFLTTRIMGRQTGLHPVVIIVAIFFWGSALGGILGMILAVPLTAFVVTAWRLARQKYFSA